MYEFGINVPAIDPIQLAADRLQLQLSDLFTVHAIAIRGRRVIQFTGRLLQDAEASYDEIQRRFRQLGYTPTLHREKGDDILIARAGVIPLARTGNPLINLLLLLATIFTTLSAGAALAGENLVQAVMSGNPLAIAAAVWAGIPFAATLMAILGVHELGHYVAARLHGVMATLPYFIPMPFNGLGTLGAFIAIKSPMKNRKVLFDIGLAGPLAGFVVALPLLVVGLLLSPVVPTYAPALSSGLTLARMGSSLLVDVLAGLFYDMQPWQTLAAHPVFFAAWLGMLITGINLLPVGQLDGGHIAYALLGRRAHQVALVTFFSLIVAGIFLSPNWYVWAFFVLIGGLRHPAPLDDITRLDAGRRLLGLFAIVLFFLVVIPQPFGA